MTTVLTTPLQVDVIGVNVADILHSQDCSELASVFQTQGHDTEQVRSCEGVRVFVCEGV